MKRDRLLATMARLLLIAGVGWSPFADSQGVPAPGQPQAPNPEAPAVTPVGRKGDVELDARMALIEDEITNDDISRANPQALPARLLIAREVETLRMEDTATSLKMLSEVGNFYSPGHHLRDGLTFLTTPLPAEEGQQDIEVILSNRRVLKLLDECSAIPKDEAGEMFSKELRTSLAAYEAMFETTWKQVVDMRQKHPIAGKAFCVAGPSLRLSSNADHTPTLLGQRLKVLSLLLIAGNLRLTGAKEEVEAAIRVGIEQRKRFYNAQSGAEEIDRHTMLCRAGLYNRQIAITALYGMTAGRFGPAAGFEKRRLTMFDAEATQYDLPWRLLGANGPDFSKGALDVWFHKKCTDEQFDELMRKHK
jgi:hypothetical protein